MEFNISIKLCRRLLKDQIFARAKLLLKFHLSIYITCTVWVDHKSPFSRFLAQNFCNKQLLLSLRLSQSTVH